MIENKMLLDILVKNNKITSAISENILNESRLTGKLAEDILVEKKIVSDEEIGKAKSEHFKIPLKIFEEKEIIPREILEIIPEETAKANKMIAFGKEDGNVLVGVIHPDDLRVQEILRFIAKQKKVNINVYLITSSDFNRLSQSYRTFEERIKGVTDIMKSLKGKGGLLHQQRVIKIEEGGVAEEAPIIKLASTIFRQAVNQRASDIHIEPQKTKLRVRFRVDGDLKNILDLPLEVHPPVVSRIKILSDLKIDETRVPQDGRFRTMIDDKEIDFRVATFPTALGEKVAIRVLDPNVGIKTIGDLGVQNYHAILLEDAIKSPFGMILATGPTGSGKSTTLYAILGELNKEDVNVVSLEDPVEYFMEGVNQSQVKPEIGYDFPSGLRQVVRQDPDIIMVGEIRDDETAALAIHAALTGHLVLSTLHTNNAIGVIPRLVDMKVETFLIPSTVILMVAQRLVRRLCDDCKKEEEATGSLLKSIEKEIAEFPEELKKQFKPPYKTYIPQGCEKCGFKGTKGRIGLFEMLRMSDELEEAILKDKGESVLDKISKEQGMISLRQDGIVKALKGLVSVEEVMRETI
jgi:type IV pilus assembly protein PilB